MFYWQGMKNVVEKILLKFWGFNVINMNLVQIVLSSSTPKYWWKFI